MNADISHSKPKMKNNMLQKSWPPESDEKDGLPTTLPHFIQHSDNTSALLTQISHVKIERQRLSRFGKQTHAHTWVVFGLHKILQRKGVLTLSHKGNQPIKFIHLIKLNPVGLPPPCPHVRTENVKRTYCKLNFLFNLKRCVKLQV